MHPKAPTRAVAPLRVLVVGQSGSGANALYGWLADFEGLDFSTPASVAVADVIAATAGGPDIVLLDFHGLPVSTAYMVSVFKGLSPAPAVFVLTHDASEVMRRRCRAARVDAVFDKTAELDLLRYTLHVHQRIVAARGADRIREPLAV